MTKDRNEIKQMLSAYINHKCTKTESIQIKEYLISHPEQIIGLIIEMRSYMMAELNMDTNTDPFKQLIGDVVILTQNDSKIASYRLQSAIESLLDEKKFSENVPEFQDDHIVSESKQNSSKKLSNNMETIKFNSSEFKAVNASTARMMGNINPEKSTLSNMVAQLLIQMPEMNPEEATNVCRQLIEGVTNFNRALDDFKTKDASSEEANESIYTQCVNMLAGKTEKEQAAILINFISFVKYIDASNIGGAVLGEETMTMEQLLSENKSVEGEITPEILDSLKEQLKEAIANSTIVLTQEAELRELISCVNGDSTLIEELAKKHMDAVDFKSYAALAAYIACLKGEIEGCDSNVQPEILGASVAAGVERERVMEEAKKGIISWEKAVKYLKWIGGALLVGLFAWVTFNLAMLLFSGTALLTVAILGSSFAGVSAGIIIGGFVGFKGASWFVDDVVKPIINGAGEVYDQIISTIKSGVILETVKKAYANMVRFFKKIWGAITSPTIAGTQTTIAG